MVSEPHQGGVRLQRGGSRRHLRGRTALQADTKGVATIRGRSPRLLTVQPSRLDSLAGPGLCARCAFSPFAAPAAIFAGIQPSRLTPRGGTLSGGVAPDYSQYSLPGWIVLLAPGLCARYAFSPFAARAAIFAGIQPSRLTPRGGTHSTAFQAKILPPSLPFFLSLTFSLLVSSPVITCAAKVS